MLQLLVVGYVKMGDIKMCSESESDYSEIGRIVEELRRSEKELREKEKEIERLEKFNNEQD